MDGLKEISRRPLVAFTEARAEVTAQTLRDIAHDLSVISWALEMAQRDVRNAETAEERAKMVAALHRAHQKAEGWLERH